MEVVGYIIAILIGISLGLIGGGGSILTVPVLVYLLKVDPVLATTYSLFIVGLTSLVGGTKAYMHKLVDFKAVSLFGIPSILTVFIARHFILPAIPQTIFSIGDFKVQKPGFLMIVFALLMLLAAISMMRNRNLEDSLPLKQANEHSENPVALLIPGLIIGLVTGILGAGGGFLIIPALVLFIRIPMKIAVGSSLLIIAINSIFGFVFSIGHFTLNWQLLFGFTALAIGGVFIGSKIAERLDGNALKKWFGWFVLLMSLGILLKELFFS